LNIKNHRDFWAGIMFIAFGVIFMLLSKQYQLGSAAKMGPGYFPTVLGGIMVALGLLILIPAFTSKRPTVKVDKIQFPAMGWILAGVLVFGLALPKLGFVISAGLLVVISAYGSHEHTWKESLISAVILAAACYLVFVKGLELQFPVWPPFLTK
jgi:prepilin signal peptidase PulO-like enzyme (type II secretory pathway)